MRRATALTCYDRYRPMNQASRIIARWSGASDVVDPERLACGAWKKAVGKRLADRTEAVKLVRSRLVVAVEDETWRSNLWSLRFQILKNIEKAIGPEIVQDVEFRVMPRRREPARETSPILQPLDDSANIADPGLRRIYRNARQRESA